jgi:hypothetical protein
MILATETLPATIVLSWFELFQAAQAGAMRRIEALKLNRKDRYGTPSGNLWGIDIGGAAAELAVAKHAGHYWEPVTRRPENMIGDVGQFQVRWTPRADGRLIVHDEDLDESRFVLVTGEPPTLTVAGAIWGGDAKNPLYWCDPGTGRPAFFIPQFALEPTL